MNSLNTGHKNMKKILYTLLFAISFSVSALTPTQNDALKAAALADAPTAACITAGNDVCVATWFNTVTTFIVWKTNVSATDVYADAGFDFTLVDGLTVGKRDEWSNFILKFGTFNPANGNIRAGIVDVWSGTTAKVAVQTAILNLSKRSATNAEKVLATGTGTNATPGLLTFEGVISTNDIGQILGR
jgi:hypothetical protein